MLKNIIGREKEKQYLNQIFKSKEAEFVAIYGRRRVGKTFLIREFFEGKGLFFELVGQKDVGLRQNLENCCQSIQEAFQPKLPLKQPNSWKKAFYLITKLIESQAKNRKIFIFLDELPWLATRRSGLIQALDYEWNIKWSRFKNLTLIVCGSAASWVIDNLINAKGGLYNRITRIIHLQPFSLKETSKFIHSLGVNLKSLQILDLYMVMGGIPHYLRQVKKGLSSVQIINESCFDRDGLLFSEFSRIFKSLFDQAELHDNIIREIAKKRSGVSREELLESLGLKSGGTFRKRLNELIESGFVTEYIPFGKSKKDYYLKIIDEYSLFYLRWIEPIKNKITMGTDPNYWQNMFNNPKYNSWSGYAFEAVCMKHTSQIIKSLKLEGLSMGIGSWRYIPPVKSKEIGAQIDLLIERTDNCINLCEIKHTNKLYSITKEYAKNLANKILMFEKRTKTNKQIFLTMITTRGIKKTIWSDDLVDSEVILDDLFT